MRIPEAPKGWPMAKQAAVSVGRDVAGQGDVRPSTVACQASPKGTRWRDSICCSSPMLAASLHLAQVDVLRPKPAHFVSLQGSGFGAVGTEGRVVRPASVVLAGGENRGGY